METKKKWFIILSILGGIILLGVRFFFTLKLLSKKNPKDLQANINTQANEKTTKDSTHQLPEITPTKAKGNEVSQEIINTPTPSKITLDEDTSITIIVPKFIPIRALHTLRQKVYKEKKVRANIIVAKNTKDYINKITKEQKSKNTDILLISTNHLQSFQDRGIHLSFKYSITSFFQPIFSELIENKKASFIPFALDPLVLWHEKELFSTYTPITLATLQNTLLKIAKKTSFPFFFGINERDADNLSQEITPYPQYFGFLQSILEQAKKDKSTYILDFFMKIPKRNPLLIKKYSELKSKDIPFCQDEPRLCILSLEKITSSPGWMSDIGDTKNLFKKDIKAHYTLNNFPLITSEYTTIGRGFLINKKSKNIGAAKKWIQGYLSVAEKSDGTLRESTLSAFNSHFQRQKIEKLYAPLQPFFKSFSFRIGTLDQNKKLINSSNFLKMLRGNYSKSIFLKEEIEK